MSPQTMTGTLQRGTFSTKGKAANFGKKAKGKEVDKFKNNLNFLLVIKVKYACGLFERKKERKKGRKEGRKEKEERKKERKKERRKGRKEGRKKEYSRKW